MIKVYKEQQLVRTAHCDMSGLWRLSAMLETMQEAAGTHSYLLGCGRDVLLQKNLVWVLSRSEIYMDVCPKVGDTVDIETFPAPNRRWFFPRYFIFRNQAGEVIGKACTVWLVMDFTTRKMAPPDAILPFMPDNSDLELPLPFPGNLDSVAGEERAFSRLPQYTDLDVNGHVNNTKYADWLCDALGIDVMKDKRICHALIHYNTEVRPGQEMALQLNLDGDAFALQGRHEDVLHLEIGGHLTTEGR